jgi:hypothetical protein
MESLTLVSDRVSKFTSIFWKELQRLMVLEPMLSPKTDCLDMGQLEQNTQNSPLYDPSYFYI